MRLSEYISIKTAINQGFSGFFAYTSEITRKNKVLSRFLGLGSGFLLLIPTHLIGFNVCSEKSQENQGICKGHSINYRYLEFSWNVRFSLKILGFVEIVKNLTWFGIWKIIVLYG